LLGEISYCVYILHVILTRTYGQHIKAFEELPVWLVYGGYWLILLLVSHFVWAGVEQPLRKWLVGLWPRPVPAAGRTSPVRPAADSVWQSLAAPGRWLLAGETLVLACLLGAVAAYATRPLSHRFLDALTAEALAAQGESGVRGACFGERFVLRGAALVPVPDGTRLRLVWQSSRSQESNQFIAIHLLDSGGKILAGTSYVRKLGRTTVPAGALWEEKVDLPRELFARASQIGICVAPDEKDNPLPITGGPCDWNEHRLLLALPAGP
jgi:hypothetical protein